MYFVKYTPQIYRGGGGGGGGGGTVIIATVMPQWSYTLMRTPACAIMRDSGVLENYPHSCEIE